MADRTEPLHRHSGRVRELRRAWRTFWWMVVRPKPKQTLSRRTELGIALRGARCGLLTAGEHSWGPLVAEYEGQRWRRQKCRWCNTKMLPASEMERNPFTEEERRRAESMIVKPTADDAARALRVAEEQGFYREGRFLWE